MATGRIDIARLRRQQIVDAAVAIINEHGIQGLSLSEIENRAGMSRGQLTYYFPTKEAILLAVFDHLVVLMHERIGRPAGPGADANSGLDWVRHLLEHLLAETPVQADFGSLQYTFLAQIGHWDDFRKRLATLYEQWRTSMAAGLAADMARRAPLQPVSPRTLASFVQALLHGLAMQRAADPEAFDPEEMLKLCLDVLGIYLWRQAAPAKRKAAPNRRVNGEPPRRRTRSTLRRGTNGERTQKR